MSGGTSKPNLVPFPIRMGTIIPTRIDFEAFVAPTEAMPPQYHDPRRVAFSVAVKHDVGDARGVVSVYAEADFEDAKDGQQDTEKAETVVAKPPYRLAVGAAGLFTYDPKEMTKEDVAKWCEYGAFYVISPYLRLLVFSVTAQSGFPMVTLPLVVVPVLREKPVGNNPMASPQN